MKRANISNFIFHSRDSLSFEPFATSFLYYYHYDPIGNVMFLTDASGNKVAEYVQEGFGNVLATSGSLTTDFWHLTTKQLEPETGLYYFYARWYDPQVGRFITRDPLREFQDFQNKSCRTFYEFAANSPLYLIDPDGMISRPAAEQCLKEARKQPNPALGCNECNTDANTDCAQAKECLRRYGINPENTYPCWFDICEIGLGEHFGINWCVHAYCCVKCVPR